MIEELSPENLPLQIETIDLENNNKENIEIPQILEELSSMEEEVEEVEEVDPVWFTAEEYPSVYFYLPENWAKKGEFILYNDQDEVIYSATITLPGEASEDQPRKAGVIEVSLKDQTENNEVPELEEGSTYLWEVQVLCNEINRSGNPTINGWIQRIDSEIQEVLEEDLNQITDELQKNEIYAEQGIWYSLVENIYSQPNSNSNDWEILLEIVGEETLNNSPILGSATINEIFEGDFPPL